jgi:hypothetical protein
MKVDLGRLLVGLALILLGIGAMLPDPKPAVTETETDPAREE